MSQDTLSQWLRTGGEREKGSIPQLKFKTINKASLSHPLWWFKKVSILIRKMDKLHQKTG